MFPVLPVTSLPPLDLAYNFALRKLGSVKLLSMSLDDRDWVFKEGRWLFGELMLQERE